MCWLFIYEWCSELSDLEKDRNSIRVPLVQERSREFSELHFLDVLIYLHIQVCRFYKFKAGKILYSVNHVIMFRWFRMCCFTVSLLSKFAEIYWLISLMYLSLPSHLVSKFVFIIWDYGFVECTLLMHITVCFSPIITRKGLYDINL